MQIQSGASSATQSATPLVAADRRPLRLRLVSLNTRTFPMAEEIGEGGALAQEFVQFALESGVLRFGQFRTKAGRMSPYFFNAGLFDDGAKLARLSEFYARRLLASGLDFDMLFGPAYKGITLAAAIALQFGLRGRSLPFSYNR